MKSQFEGSSPGRSGGGEGGVVEDEGEGVESRSLGRECGEVSSDGERGWSCVWVREVVVEAGSGEGGILV